jgi:hippurate hydrolase
MRRQQTMGAGICSLRPASAINAKSRQLRKFLNGFVILLAIGISAGPLAAAACAAIVLDSREAVETRIQQEYPSLFELYKYLHSHPELSLQEQQTATTVAAELRKAGYEVTAEVGKHGIVAVLRNGSRRTVLVRSDMDALPVKEATGLPYASTATATNAQGLEVSTMHACGHDVHMTCLVGTARILSQLKDRWHGTLILIGQPAEEAGGGARAMLADGLFERFPRPDFCLALHDSAELPAGKIGYTPGYAMANVDFVNITVHGVGGHGAYPNKTKDPIVLAAQIVLALQTIVSRETEPVEPAVVTVGSIHGGTKHNIIPDEVLLQITIRSYSDEVRKHTIEAIKRIARGQALSAGIPEERLPDVSVQEDSTPATYNDPELTAKLAGLFKTWFGENNVIQKKPTMGGEDFSEFGRVPPKIPICMFTVGGVPPNVFKESERTGHSLPSLHSSLWAPLPEPTIKTGTAAMVAAVLALLMPP